MSPVSVLSVRSVESMETKQLEEEVPELFPVCSVINPRQIVRQSMCMRRQRVRRRN